MGKLKPVLLDTNALAMTLTGDQRLPSVAQDLILSTTTVLVTAISFYEIGQKVRLGKWDAMRPMAPRLIEICLEDGFHLVPLSPSQALEASLLEWSHRDPFDRMIAAVARSEDADLVSSDTAFDALKGVHRVWA